MNIYNSIPLILGVILIGFTSYTYAVNKKTDITRTFFIYLFFAIAYHFKEFFQWSNLGDEFPIFILRATAWIWIGFGFAFCNFVYGLTRKKKDLLYYIFGFSTLFLIIVSFSTDLIIADYQKYYWGIQGKGGLFMLFANIWCVVVIGLYSIFILIQKLLKTENPLQKKELKLVTFGTLVILLVGATISILLPQILDLHNIPRIGSTFLFFHSLFVIYAISEIKELSIDAGSISEKLFSGIMEGVVVLDKNKKIVQINKAAKHILNISTDVSRVDLSHLVLGYNYNLTYIDQVLKIFGSDNKFISLSQTPLKLKDKKSGKIIIFKEVESTQVEAQATSPTPSETDSSKLPIWATELSLKMPPLLNQILNYSSIGEHAAKSSLTEKATVSFKHIQQKSNEVVEILGNYSKKIKKIAVSSDTNDLYGIVKEAADEYENLLKAKKISLDITKGDISTQAYFDSNLIHDVIENLISCAINISYEGKKINISMENSQLAHKSNFVSALQLDIISEGNGITKNEIENIFTENSSITFSHIGNQIKTSLIPCHEVIESHNGKISLFQDPETKGITFSVLLPRNK